jgi:protein-S-isoprenylcysteine O-methyltransferase Ste14
MSVQRSPWEFRGRAWLSFVIYFVGFTFGYAIDSALGGHGTPTFVRVGLHWGDAGVRVCEIIAALLTIGGFLLRWWGSSYHQAGVVYSSALEAASLAASGPYRYTRNPLYLGNMLQAAGISSIGPPATMVIILALLSAFVYRLIFLEEAYLRSMLGEAYTSYTAAVPRLFPRLSPKLPKGEQRPRFFQGFITELGTLGFAICVSYIAVANPNGPTVTLYVLFYVAVAFFFLSGVLNRRMSRAAQARKESP